MKSEGNSSRLDAATLAAIEQRHKEQEIASRTMLIHRDRGLLLLEIAALQQERDTWQQQAEQATVWGYDKGTYSELLARAEQAEQERDELRAEVEDKLSDHFKSVPACYDTPLDHYREMARRLSESRDELKHDVRDLQAELAALRQERDALELRRLQLETANSEIAEEIEYWQTCAQCGVRMEAPGHCPTAHVEQVVGLEAMHEETLTRAEQAEAELAALRAQHQAHAADAAIRMLEYLQAQHVYLMKGSHPLTSAEFIAFVANALDAVLAVADPRASER